MAIFRIQVHKEYQNQKWSNVYHTSANTLFEAAATATLLATAERSFHTSVVYFPKITVSTGSKGDRVHTTVGVGAYGQFTTFTDLEITENCVRVDFETPGGDSGHKYYKVVLSEGEKAGYALSGTTWQSRREAMYNSLFALIDFPYLTKENGVFYTDLAIQNRVGNRQMHRKRRRR